MRLGWFFLLLAPVLSGCELKTRRAEPTGVSPGSVAASVSEARRLPAEARESSRVPREHPGASTLASQTAASHPGNEGLEPARVLEWDFADPSLGSLPTVVRVPARRRAERLPVLIALHGRGETRKGPERGARGWLADYGLAHAIERLHSPPLEQRDLLGLVTKERLERINRALDAEPFRDLIVVMPYVPDRFQRERLFDNGPRYGAWVVETLLPKVRAEAPAASAAAATGIDGVSLGGRAALLVGLSFPEQFGTLGSLQAAIDESELGELVRRAKRAQVKNPRLKLRFLTSHEDYYLSVNQDFSARLRAAGVRHRLEIVSGNHSYEFNRGPGAVEMLLFHSRELWR